MVCFLIRSGAGFDLFRLSRGAGGVSSSGCPRVVCGCLPGAGSKIHITMLAHTVTGLAGNDHMIKDKNSDSV